jgi:hypothetical protein
VSPWSYVGTGGAAAGAGPAIEPVEQPIQVQYIQNQPVFIRVYRLENTVRNVGISTQLCKLSCPLTLHSLVHLSPPPLPLVNKFTHIQCVRGGGYWVLGLRQINTCRIVPLQLNFL